MSGILIEKSKWLTLWYAETKKLEKAKKGVKKKRGKQKEKMLIIVIEVIIASLNRIYADWIWAVKLSQEFRNWLDYSKMLSEAGNIFLFFSGGRSS